MDDLAYVYRTQGYYSTSHRDIAILTDIDRSPFFIADHCNQAGIVGLGSWDGWAARLGCYSIELMVGSCLGILDRDTCPGYLGLVWLLGLNTWLGYSGLDTWLMVVLAEGSRHLASVGLGMAGDEGGRLNACTKNIQIYISLYMSLWALILIIDP